MGEELTADELEFFTRFTGRTDSCWLELLAGGPMPVASCITLAIEHGLSTRTSVEARSRMPIRVHRPCRALQPGLVAAGRRHGPAVRVETAAAAVLRRLRGAAGGRALASSALSAMRRQVRKAEISAHGQSNRKRPADRLQR
jgi:hypothetical protein